MLLENNSIDIFSVSETWLHSGISSNILAIPGYGFVRHDREVEVKEHLVKRGGGLGVYYNPDMLCDSDTLRNRSISSKDLELQVLQFTRKNARKIVLFNVYRPPNGVLDNALDHLNETVMSIPQYARKDIVILGDFNVDVLNRRHREAKSLKYFASVNGLSQFIKCPTRCTPTSDKAIDLIFSNVDYIVKSGTIDFFISDHQPVFIVKKKPTTKHMKTQFTGRTYRNYNQQILDTKLGQLLDRNRITNESDPSRCWNYLIDDITCIADDVTPKKYYKIRRDKPAWLTYDLLNMQKDRDYFYKKAKRTKTQADWQAA